MWYITLHGCGGWNAPAFQEVLTRAEGRGMPVERFQRGAWEQFIIRAERNDCKALALELAEVMRTAIMGFASVVMLSVGVFGTQAWVSTQCQGAQRVPREPKWVVQVAEQVSGLWGVKEKWMTMRGPDKKNKTYLILEYAMQQVESLVQQMGTGYYQRSKKKRG